MILQTVIFFAQLEFAWCQCLCQSETNKKEPFISEMINFLVNKLGGKKFRITRSTIFAYMFVGFFIIFTDRQITFSKYLKISESHLEIHVPKSKTDQREGHIAYISQASWLCCPVKLLEKNLQKTNIKNSKVIETHLIGRNFRKEILYSKIREVFKD